MAFWGGVEDVVSFMGICRFDDVRSGVNLDDIQPGGCVEPLVGARGSS